MIVGEDEGISMFDSEFLKKQNCKKEFDWFGKKYQLHCHEFVAIYFAQFLKIIHRLWKVKKVFIETRKGFASFNDV